MCVWTHLDQQLDARDPLEGEDEEGAQGKPLADGTPLQLLHDPLEPLVFIPTPKGHIIHWLGCGYSVLKLSNESKEVLIINSQEF